MVTHSENITYLNNFISLQELRVVHRNTIYMDIQAGEEDFLIAPLLLIPLVENAFKHGDFSSPEQTAVHLYLRIENQKLLFEVKNKKKNFRKDTASGIGLKNMQRRLDLIYPEKHQLKTNYNDTTYETRMEVVLE